MAIKELIISFSFTFKKHFTTIFQNSDAISSFFFFILQSVKKNQIAYLRKVNTEFS
jgi:hypothetical protein